MTSELITRLGKGQPLTFQEMDNNWVRCNTNDESRTVFISNAGEADSNGFSVPNAVDSFAQALTIINALSPTPTPVNGANIVCLGRSTFVESYSSPDAVGIDAPSTIINSSDPVTFSAGSSAFYRIGSIINTAPNGVATLIDGKSQVGISSNTSIAIGTNGVAIKIVGSTSDIFDTVGQASCDGVGSTGIYINTTDNDSEVLRGGEIALNANDTTGVDFNKGVGKLSSIAIVSITKAPAAANTTGVLARGGGNYVIGTLTVNSDTAIEVKENSTLTTTNGLVKGSIVVDSGCVLNVGRIQQAQGTITNNGTINGIINGVPYGDAIQSSGLGYILATWGANLQNTGRFPAINGTENQAEVAGLGISASAQVPADGTIDVVTYYSATGDNTTQFKIIKNGQLMYTFTCDAAYGRETGIGVPVVVGDNIALEYDAGTTPANGIYTMYIK